MKYEIEVKHEIYMETKTRIPAGLSETLHNTMQEIAMSLSDQGFDREEIINFIGTAALLAVPPVHNEEEDF